MGQKIYKLLHTLKAFVNPADKTLTDNVERNLQNHLSPKSLVIWGTFLFNKQNKKMNIPDYVAELRKFTEHCQLGDSLNDAWKA